MNRFQNVRAKINFRLVLWISLIWAALGVIDSLNTQTIALSALFSLKINFSMSILFWLDTSTAFIAGLIGGFALVFHLRERTRNLPYGLSMLINTVALTTISFFITVIFYEVFFVRMIRNENWLTLPNYQPFIFMTSPFYLKKIVFWVLVSLLTILTLNVNEKYGPGILMKLIAGHYHRPSEEMRIFMFVDLKSSTMIAERLGHIEFFNLLNDFFRDITDSIIYTRGEVYQYVGDEVVISWSLKNATRNANCIKCFFGMQEAIKKAGMRYKERYGFVPEFKAGMHYGNVTVGEIGILKRDIVYSGDVLNTASRIQAMCNKFRVKILVSKALLELLNMPPHQFIIKRMGNIELKGKKQKVELYTFQEGLEVSLPVPAISAT